MHNPLEWVDPLGLTGQEGGKKNKKGKKNTKGKGDKVDLTEHRKEHILNRHRHGANKPDKTEFPAHWSDDDILHHVSDVATDPSSASGVGKWDSPYVTGMRDGIDIRVDFYPPTHPTLSGKISTAYPTNVTPNPPKP
ncbi:EndoU domain-containing protein [Pectobacterium brasiliense]|uniref:EndoU domain-containing protein n=1 Tax=Pectobacterium brasiliense TaxID=180957 RepID=UPI00227CB868|nr:EndoU domain-containing protein [Pectobacterium brasiliense]WGL27035.1 EndoU domain-containing protein [Pectobacterium brasiliense]WJM80021.1 EndoU domain-containing protein [Pectobacterium brasiliense]